MFAVYPAGPQQKQSGLLHAAPPGSAWGSVPVEQYLAIDLPLHYFHQTNNSANDMLKVLNLVGKQECAGPSQRAALAGHFNVKLIKPSAGIVSH